VTQGRFQQIGGKIQRITRTLDAFQHYVVAKSDERLLIADLQGKISSQFGAEHVLTHFVQAR
jgi:Alpha-kinase family